MFVKDGKNFKTLYSRLTAEQIRKMNLIARISAVVTFVGLIVIAFIKQEAVEVLFEKYSWFGSVSVLITFIPLVISAFCFINMFKAYKIRASLTTNELPRGLVGENKTFGGLELQAAAGVLVAAYEVVIMVCHPSILTGLCTAISLCVAAAALTVRIVTAKAFAQMTEEEPVEEHNEEIEEFYD